MSRGVLINTVDTYIGTALYEEFLGENPSESAPAFIKKMLKRSKPVLFRKYMREKMDCYIFDLHSGRLDDLKWAVWALTNEPLDSEKTLIVISSVLSWGGNEPKMVEVKPKKKKPVEEGEEPPQEGEEKEEEEKEEEEKEDEEKKEEEEKKDEEEKKEEEVEPQLDENGNPIEPPKQEFDEYGNEILEAKLDEQGNEILPPNDDDFEYYFEDDFKEKKRLELEEQKKKEQEELEKLKEENPEEYKKIEEEQQKQKEEEEKKKSEEKPEEEKKEEDEEEKQDEENPEEEGEEKKRIYKRVIKVKIIKPKIYKRVGFREKDYKQRIPIEFYKRFKEYEDYLLDLKFENLSIFIICAGIPYGGCETTFNYFFKSAWLQNPIELPYYNEGNNLIPTIHIKDLARMVRRIADNKAEFPYIFAFDKTKDTSLKNIISSISRNIGSGKTVSVPYDKDLIKNIALKEEDFFIDKEKYEKNKLVMNITKHELTWTRFLGIDVMLRKSKYLGEDYEWYCKEKIILNCKNENYRKLFAEKISKFYNIPIINFELIMEKLNQNISEDEEVKYMNEKYYKLKERIDFLEANPDYKNEANELLYDKNEILYECLKYLLKSNAAVNRGYVLEGMPVNMDEINRIYYYKKEMKPNPDEEEEKPPEEEELEEEEEEKKDEEKNEEEKKEEENKENEEEKDEEKKEEGEEEEEKKDEEEENKENEENKDEEKKEEEKNPEENEESPDGEGKKKKKKKKKKKIKPKKYKTKFEKTLLPESVISLSKIDKKTSDVDVSFWEVEQFYQENQIEIMNLVYEDEEKDDPEETFEMMRIYIERNGRPFNYFKLKDSDINVNRINYVENKKNDIDNRIQKEEKEKQEKIDEEESLYWKKMEERIESIKKDKSQLEENQKVPTRKFLLVNIMPTLTKGLLEVCKINPIDPIDYLADFLFTNSTGEK